MRIQIPTFTEEKTLETEANIYHEKLSKLAKQSQRLHEEMRDTLNKTYTLQSDADDMHQKFLETKQKAQLPHQKYIELSCQIKSLKQELHQIEDKRQLELRKELEERALEKLKRGEKLTWQEFKVLAEKGIT